MFETPRSFVLLRELAKGHLLISRDAVRIQVRLESVYRSRDTPTLGASVYGTESDRPGSTGCRCPRVVVNRDSCAQLVFRVEHKQRAEAELIEERAQHSIARLLRTCPGLGPIRVTRLLSIVVTPHRFRTREQFWSDCGRGIVMRSSSGWVQIPEDRWVRSSVPQTRSSLSNTIRC